MVGLVTSEEAARRLGIKLTTLYAYVSRGLLVPHRGPDRRSLFEVEDIEALASRRGSTAPREARLATVTTAITEIRPEGPRYRGVPVAQLARTESFERVAELLWQQAPGVWEPVSIGPAPMARAGDRLRWAVVMCGCADPLRADRRPVAVVRAARTVIATMVEVLDRGPGEGSIAERLAVALAPEPRPAVTEAIRAALVLLADHELATSTLAVRTAASTRSDLYGALLAGLGASGGPLHAGASRAAHLVLEDAERRGAPPALDRALGWRPPLAGFGHGVYAADPRFEELWSFVQRVSTGRVEVVSALLALATERGLPPPNVDLGLAALSFVSGMDAESGSVLFEVARTAGWVAHYLEELAEAPLRYRARAIYATPRRLGSSPAPSPQG